jgi:aryl-alcohol dehydrogenase-like predicted oxidoreductase
MEERRLGPVVGLGTWNTFGPDAALAQEVVDAAYDAGVRLYDSSPMYRGAEAALGKALAGRGTVATKIWARTVEEGREQYRRQREWFGRVEIEQIHNLVSWREHLEWLKAEHDGLVGVTHYSARAFGELAAALRTGAFDVVQLPYNPHEREVEHELLPLAAELGVRVIVMRPLAEGALVRREVDPRALEELGVASWPEALLKWALSDERVDAVIPATRRAERARTNARAGEPPWLTPEQRALVAELAA